MQIIWNEHPLETAVRLDDGERETLRRNLVKAEPDIDDLDKQAAYYEEELTGAHCRGLANTKVQRFPARSILWMVESKPSQMRLPVSRTSSP